MSITFPNEFGVSAVAVNSQISGSSPGLLQDVANGKYQVLLISPESLLSPRFIKHVLSNPTFVARVVSVVIDEAHCVSLYGAGFRKLYGMLSMVRAFLPQGLPFIALSATLTPRVRQDLVSRLQLRADYEFINEGNNRTNVTLAVRRCVHPLDSYRDLKFVIPPDCSSALGVPKTFIYADTIEANSGIVDFLMECLPSNIRSQGIIRPYNATCSTVYRRAVMELFRRGVIRVLVCTDAAGMGCNIRDIARVVQWKVPDALKAYTQRAGRVARDPLLTGLALLLAEPSAYQVDPIEPAAPKEAEGARRGQRSAVGRPRRSRGTKKRVDSDEIDPSNEPDVRQDSPGGGIYALVQTKKCRRGVIDKVFRNPNLPERNLTVPCCDLCDASVAENIAPVAAVPRQSQKDRRNGTKTKKCALNDTLRVELTRWREEVCRAKYSHTLLAPNAFLDDSTIDLIASRTNVDDRVVLSNLLAKDWYFWPRYGDALLARIQTHSQTIRQPVETPQPPTQTVQSVQKPARNTHEPTKVKGANPVAIDSKPVDPAKVSSRRSIWSKRAATICQIEGPALSSSSKRQKKLGEDHAPVSSDPLLEPRLLQIPPAPEHLQLGVSPMRAPPGSTPVVPSQRPATKLEGAT